MPQKPLDMVSVEMEAVSIINKSMRIFYQDIRLYELESEDGLENGDDGCENKVMEGGDDDDGKDNVIVSIEVQEDLDLIGRSVFVPVPVDQGFVAEIWAVVDGDVLSRRIDNNVEFSATVPEVRKWLTDAEAALWAPDAVTDAEAANADEWRPWAPLEPGVWRRWHCPRDRMERDLALFTKRRERRERKKKKKTSSRSDLPVTEKDDAAGQSPPVGVEVGQPWLNIPEYSRRLIRGTGWISIRCQAWEVQIKRHNFEIPGRKRSALVQWGACRSAAFTLARAVKCERRLQAVGRAAVRYARLGDHGASARATARSFQLLVQAETLRASACRMAKTAYISDTSEGSCASKKLSSVGQKLVDIISREVDPTSLFICDKGREKKGPQIAGDTRGSDTNIR